MIKIVTRIRLENLEILLREAGSAKNWLKKAELQLSISAS